MLLRSALLQQALCTLRKKASLRAINEVKSAQIYHTLPQRTLSYTAPVQTSDNNNSRRSVDIAEYDIDEATRTKIKELALELALYHADGKEVCDPADVLLEDWMFLLTLRSRSARMKEYRYLMKRNESKARQVIKHAKWKEQNLIHSRQVQQLRKENPHIVYGLGYTSLFRHISKTVMDRFRNYRLIETKAFNTQKIVFDNSVADTMSKKSNSSVASQITLSFCDNRNSTDPFDMRICNYRSQTLLGECLLRQNPKLLGGPLECHKESVIQMFPKERIVYLSPFSPNILNKYNPKDILVLSSLIEKSQNANMGYCKARELGVRSAWFPLHHYLDWGSADKGLPLNTIVRILLEWKRTQDWAQALKHVPKRKFLYKRGPRLLLESNPIFGKRNETQNYSHETNRSQIFRSDEKIYNPFD